MTMPPCGRTAAFLLLLACTSVGAHGQERPRLRAAPATETIQVDARLDEAAWQQADPATGFRQFEPAEGAPATQPTEVRVLYGPAHLYVGATLRDDDPGAVQQTLGRRDDINQADWFFVSIDSYLDQRTAYTFAVNAAGVQFDATRAGSNFGPNRGMDPSWDAIWTSAVQQTPDGWVAELRIPYSMLRFPEAGEQTWGIHFSRYIPRLGERSEWPLVPRAERANLVAQYGLLHGLSGIAPRRNVQLRPYTVTRLHMAEDALASGEAHYDASLDVGGDLKVGLGSNLTLDATFNPDFGQVESDPAVLNLTAFETFFEERRPFFVEGAQIFHFAAGPGALLYTRRIGAEAPIIGAAKLSGRTARGLSLGVLGATTGDAFRPERHYGVARLSQQIGRYSSTGGIVTVFDGPTAAGRLRAIGTGADYDLRLRDNRYGIEGFTALTHRSLPTGTAETGVAGKVWGRKRQGDWTGFLGLDLISDHFDPGDVGRLNENNLIAQLLSIDYDLHGGRAFGPFQRAGIGTFTFQSFSYNDGLYRGLRTGLDARADLRGFQEVGLEVSLANPFGGYDPYETRGLGPWAPPLTFQVAAEYETDGRRPWQFEPQVGLSVTGTGGQSFATGLQATWNVGTRLSLRGDLEAEWQDGVVAWSSNEAFRRDAQGWAIGTLARAPERLGPDDYLPFDDGGALDLVLADGTPGAATTYYHVPAFGSRNTRVVDFTLRSSITFRPNLSLQFYGQLFVARGRYEAFQLLRDRDTLVPFDAFPKRNDFALSSFTANTVLRWEYRPGSTLYVVWTQGREDDDRLAPLGPWDPSPFDTPLDEQITDVFGIFPDNVFLVKLSHTFLR